MRAAIFPETANFRKPHFLPQANCALASRFRAGAAAPRGLSLFQIVAVPFDAFQSLPCPEHRWLLTRFSRYVDRTGKAFPSLRQLARDTRMSLGPSAAA